MVGHSSDDGWDVASRRRRRRSVGTSWRSCRSRDGGRTDFIDSDIDGDIENAIAGCVADFDFLRGPRGEEGVVAVSRLEQEAGAGLVGVDGNLAVVSFIKLLKTLMNKLKL